MMRLVTGLMRGWVRLYTAGLPPDRRDDRRAEIASDLWEHERDTRVTGGRPEVMATTVLGRWLIGVTGDLSWRMDQTLAARREGRENGIRIDLKAQAGMMEIVGFVKGSEMLVYTIRRLILMLPILFGVLLVTYTLGFYGPGDPLVIMFGEEERIPDPEILARLKRIHGLDRPFFVQFGDYLGVWKNNKGEYDGLLQGNFGTSLIDKRPVNEKIRIGMPVSFQLGIAAGVVMIVVGVPLGILAAVKQNSWIDYSIIAGAIAVRSVPVFVLAPMLMILLVLKLDVLSKVPIGWHGIFAQAAILPVGLMAATSILLVIRMARAGIIEVLSENYVRTARAKGLLERTVLTRHVMKNSMTPVLTSMGLAAQRPGDRRHIRRAHLCRSRAGPGRHHGLQVPRLPRDPGGDRHRRVLHHHVQSAGRPRIRPPGPAGPVRVDNGHRPNTWKETVNLE